VEEAITAIAKSNTNTGGSRGIMDTPFSKTECSPSESMYGSQRQLYHQLRAVRCLFGAAER
jgi:hypothetical protein